MVNFDFKTFIYGRLLRLTAGGMVFALGNEKLSLLTLNKKYKLRIEMVDFKGVNRWAEYSTFLVNPASDKYRLTATGISGTAGPGRHFLVKHIHFSNTPSSYLSSYVIMFVCIV